MVSSVILKEKAFVDKNKENCSIVIENTIKNNKSCFKVYVIMNRTNDIIVNAGETFRWSMAKHKFNHLKNNIDKFLPVSEETKKHIQKN